MKKLTILLVIIFTFLFSTTSWGDWSYVAKNVSGDKYYYDKDRVRKSGKYIYFWELQDFLKPKLSSCFFKVFLFQSISKNSTEVR